MNSLEFNKKKIYSEASGTMAVVDSNIKMTLNDHGLYEETLVDKTKEISRAAELVSPNLNGNVNESIIADQLFKTQQGIDFDERIGYFNSLYVGHVDEDDYRKEASSGGFGTWILKELFVNDLVDYVIHVKKNTDNNSAIMFKYDISNSLSEIKNGAKTKYYPVELSEVMQKVKECPGRYVVVGIPSFIYAIRLLCKEDSIINDRIKYTVGLICGHQKSSKFAESMAWQVGIKPGDLKEIDFRHKLLNKPANQYGIKLRGLVDGKDTTIVKENSELYGQNWGWGLFKPTASNFTDDVFNETADIVLGDAWLPKYTSDSKGNNIIIIRNSEINSLVSNALNEKRLMLDSVDVETIFNSQISHYRHTHDELAYRLFIQDQLQTWRPDKRVKASKKFSKFRKEVQDLRISISEYSHIEYQRAVEKENFEYFITHLSKYTDKYTKIYLYHNRINMIKEIGITGIVKKVWNKLGK
ncbi:Coenzyme F420 hydrogenase/dehydrogenase, beta subunit C-terminal domain [Aerococcus urinaeequi]|uniref:Coenzyme F420 hydrogenase/dehydrogenase, beta subunit C-terminal domain n=1 Tax=Aerococcus urinaeequi TaxID=51665 RepID=UPI003D6A4156